VAEARRRAALDGLVYLRTVLLSRCSWERKPALLNATRLTGDEATRDRGASSRELEGAGSREFVGASFNAALLEEVDGELLPFLARHAFFKVDAAACERKEGKSRSEVQERKQSSGGEKNVGERKEVKEREERKEGSGGNCNVGATGSLVRMAVAGWVSHRTREHAAKKVLFFIFIFFHFYFLGYGTARAPCGEEENF
jgi:hypothetical protein